jgi:hypothetical protein
MKTIQEIHALLPKMVDSSFLDYDSDVVMNRKIFHRYVGKLQARIIYDLAPIWVRFRHPDIYKAQMKARADGGLEGAYQWVRIWEICKIVKRWKISSILEFGSGASSSMFAKLIDDKEKFISVEENEYWAKRSLAAAGIYAKKMNLIRAARIIVNIDDESCTKYDLPTTFYEKYFDMVYIDGPTAKKMDGDEELYDLKILDKRGFMPNVDIEYHIDRGMLPRIIVIDGRRGTVRRLIYKLSSSYNIILRYSYEHPLARSGKFYYHTIFIKK